MKNIWFAKCVFILTNVVGVSAWALELNPQVSDPECLIPFQKLSFEPADAINGDPSVHQAYRNRYLVGDFNTVDETTGQCRGVQEIYPREEFITDLQDAGARESYERLEQVSRAAEAKLGKTTWGPVNKPGIVKFNGQNICIGQRLLVCELQKTRGGIAARLIARFIAASRKTEVAGSNGFYSSFNYIKARFADGDLTPTYADNQRDALMGLRYANVARYAKRVPLPNYIPFGPMPGYTGHGGSGLHEKTAAVGQVWKDFMGTPMSLGCVRLEDYPAKFVRWYLPTGARFFIYYQEQLYRKLPPK